jgi:two-component system sensor histidine kinase YesM
MARICYNILRKWFESLVAFFSLTIRRQLIVAFLILIVVPLFLTNLISFVIVKDIVKQKANANNNVIFSNVHNNITGIMKNMLLASNSIMFDYEIPKITDISGMDESDRYFARARIARKFSQITFSTLSTYMDSIITIIRDGSAFSSLPVSESSRIYNDIILNEGISPGSPYICWAEHPYSFSSGQKRTDYLVLLRTYVDYYTGVRFGDLFIGIRKDYFNTTMKNLITTNETSAFIITGSGNILASAGAENKEKTTQILSEFAEMDKRGFSSVNMKDLGVTVNLQKLMDSEWYMVQIIPNEAIVKEVAGVRNTLMVVVLACCLVFIFVAFIIARNISIPIQNISNASKDIASGKLGLSVEIVGSREMREMAGNFNIMSQQIKDLIESNKAVERQKRMYELQALYAQINPHFLFNALNSIKLLAETSRVYNISKFIQALAGILKNSIINKEEMITLREELSEIRNYMLLQNLRFLLPIEEEYDVPEDIMEYMVPKLILQPIVENSLIHGFEGIKRIPRIRISGVREGRNIRITIKDNGKGMDEKCLKNLLNDLRMAKTRLNSVGIPNVNERLKINFGDEYGIIMHSKLDEGTVTEILIPALVKGDLHELQGSHSG